MKQLDVQSRYFSESYVDDEPATLQASASPQPDVVRVGALTDSNAYSAANLRLEELLRECVHIDRFSEFSWFMTFRCLPWLGAKIAVVGVAENLQGGCCLRAFSEFGSDKQAAICKVDLERAVRVLVLNWRKARQPIAVTRDETKAASSIRRLFDLQFPNASRLTFHAQKDMCSPAFTFCILEAGATNPSERLSMIMPAVQNALVRVIKTQSSEQKSSALTSLTSKERELLQMMASGQTDDEMARQLHRSVHTVKNQIRRMFERYGFANRVHAVSLGFAASVISPIANLSDSVAKK